MRTTCWEALEDDFTDNPVLRDPFVRRLVVVLAMLCCSSAVGGTIDPSTPDSAYVAFGKQFPSVVRIRSEKLLHAQYGSAVVIRPHWALTAAHVVYEAFDHTAKDDNGVVYPLSVYPHCDFNNEVLGDSDIALCYSAKDFGLKFYTPLYTGRGELGSVITIAGYGLTGTFRTGASLSDGKRRAGQNKIEAAAMGVLICSASVGADKLPLEFMIASGDSGGGMYIGNKLAGINSFLMASDKVPNGSYGDESAFTRISTHAAWIEREIAKHELEMRASATMGPDISR